MNSTRSFVSQFFILSLLIVVLSFFFISVLFEKSILATNYYNRLAQSNRIRTVAIASPRGVFYDRNGRLLVKNQKDKKYGYIREYLFPQAFSHVLGYLKLPDKKSLKDYSCGDRLASNQLIGAVGLEKTFECMLRGTQGYRYIEVNARGKEIAEIARLTPVPGRDVNLTIDISLQNIAYKELENKKGAVIASNPKNGDIYIFVSSPAYNPNELMRRRSAYSFYLQDKDRPLLNRVVLGTYPPGSVVKPVYALASLENKVISKSTTYEDTGEISVGGKKFGNWYFLQYGKKEGIINVSKAISRSNDIFFYKIGMKSGNKALAAWLREFRYDKLDLSSLFPQQSAVIPTSKWKERVIGEKWYLGDTINLSIGQGYLLVTPAQIHSSFSIIADDGYWCEFNIIKGNKSRCSKVVKTAKDNLLIVKSGMRQACERGGTAWPFFDFKVNGKKIAVGCKTGTAEASGQNKEPHAWFTAFAPFDNPEIAITVLVENGGEGSSVAAPIAKKIFTRFFSDKN